MKANSLQIVAHEIKVWLAVLVVMVGSYLPFCRAGLGEPSQGANDGSANSSPPENGLHFSANPTEEEIFKARIFVEPLVPVGGKPSTEDNSAFAAALVGYSHRSGPDDFASLTAFLEGHPQSPWKAALLTDMGFEYYNSAHYSLAINAWSNAWTLAEFARDAKSLALIDRSFGELVTMDARLGRMDHLDALLKSIGKRRLLGPAAEKVVNAREALWNMQNRPEISFRCGPLALRSIRIAQNLDGSSDLEILKSASTQQGCSLPQVAELSKKIGLNYQIAFRSSGEYLMPSVVHWKVGHFAAVVGKTGNLYELQDPTFGNKTWATKAALDAETSGYCLVPPGDLPAGWRAVDEKEGATIWGKGMTGGNDPQHIGKNDLATGGSCPAPGMAVARIHLMAVNLDVIDNPVGYDPPIGPPVRFFVRYNQRDIFQPGNFSYGNLGPQWTSDWFTYITDTPSNQVADVNLYLGGGGQRTYTGFNTNTQSFAYQQYDQNLLTRTGPASYQLLSGDGSKKIYSHPDGSSGSSRNLYLSQEIDPQGNALSFIYNSDLCLIAVVDAIGQITTLTYGLASTNIGSGPDQTIVPADPYKLTKVTDPFGRSATFNYQPTVVSYYYTYFNGQISSVTASYAWGLASITDVIGITSQFGYVQYGTPVSQFLTEITSVVDSLTTPYGTTTFFGGDNGNARSMQINYPDGSRERVEYSQSNTNQPLSEPLSSVPSGMLTTDSFLQYRDSYYWNRTACDQGYGDYSKARLYHFLHTENLGLTSGCLESVKQPLESRVWFDYPGQSSSVIISPYTQPAHMGRVVDDGTTQLYSYAYNPFGHKTKIVDPIGRSTSFVYDTNNIDLLEVRQTSANHNDLLFKAGYNSQHLPITVTDASGQTFTYTYNARGELVTATSPKNETTTFTYGTNGYLLAVDGPLAGTGDTGTAAYDAFGRVRTFTSELNYVTTYDYDNLDRPTRVTYPDGTTSQFVYDRLDCSMLQDRAGRQTLYQHDSLRQLTSQTDPLHRVTHFDWCRCGSIKSITDPLGRTTSWTVDVEGRKTAKQYADGTQVRFFYETTTPRLKEIVDEKQQTALYNYNPDNTIQSIGFGNAQHPTATITYTYDLSYRRVATVADQIGLTTFNYVPVTSPPQLGAGQMAGITGPLPNQSITYTYDEMGRRVQTTVDGAVSTRTYEAGGRLVGESNLLGSFVYTYDGPTRMVKSATFPNGQTATIGFGDVLHDFLLQQITFAVGSTPVSQFSYGRDISRDEITTWSQQMGALSPAVYSFNYDQANQLLSASVTNSGALVNSYNYSYDLAGNRVSEQIGSTSYAATYNSLNELSTTTVPEVSHTNEWDGAHRLVAVNAANQRTEFTYDGQSRLVSIRQLTNGVEASRRWFVWCDGRICEERDATGTNITKRFFQRGVKLESGPNAGVYYYTRDHLGSVRDLTDAGGNVRARYAYDPFGRRTKVSGDVDADFGYTDMLWSSEASLFFARYRAYDPQLGRWLSRDPLRNAEKREGPNLYAYVGNEPINNTDPSGLGVGLDSVTQTCTSGPQGLAVCIAIGEQVAENSEGLVPALENIPQAIENCAPDLVNDASIVTSRLNDLASRAPDAVNKLEQYLGGDPADEFRGDNILSLGVDYTKTILSADGSEIAQDVTALPFGAPPQAWIELGNDAYALAPNIANILARIGYAGGDVNVLTPHVSRWLAGLLRLYPD